MAEAPPEWFAPLPAGFPRATKVGILRGRFGTLGIALPAVLLAEAEAQHQTVRGRRPGVVKAAFADLAYLTADEPDRVRDVVVMWIDMGEMVDADVREHDFEARWKDWDKWRTDSPALAAAKAFLRDALADGQDHPSAEIEAQAKAHRISDRTLDRARTALDVRARKEGGEWFMSLPA